MPEKTNNKIYVELENGEKVPVTIEEFTENAEVTSIDNEAKVIDILGDRWMIEFVASEDDDILSEGTADGYCDPVGKRIVINDMEDEAHENISDKEQYIKTCLRHELIHAALFSSGLGFSWEHSSQGHDETMVDWVANQWQKLVKIFEQAEAI